MKINIDLISWIFVVLSVLSGFLVTSNKSKFRLIAFFGWFISNLFWILFNLYFKHWSTSVLFFIYLIQSIVGIVNNYKNKEK